MTLYAKTYKSYKECLILCKNYLLIQEKREKNTAAITFTKLNADK